MILHNSLGKMHAFDVPQLAAFAYIKADKAAAYIFPSKQLGACFGYIKKQQRVVPLDAGFPVDALRGFPCCFIQRVQ